MDDWDSSKVAVVQKLLAHCLLKRLRIRSIRDRGLQGARSKPCMLGVRGRHAFGFVPTYLGTRKHRKIDWVESFPLNPRYCLLIGTRSL